MLTWLPPLLGFTNTSRGFMRGDGVGLMMKGLQRPSWETQPVRLPQVLADPTPMLSRTPGCPPCTTSGSELMVGLATERQLAV